MRRIDCCRVVLITSAVWFIIDLILILYILDTSGPGRSSKQASIEKHTKRSDGSVGEIPDKTLTRTTATELNADAGVLAKLMRGLRFDSGGPGEMGKAVHIEKERENEMKEKFRENQFNLMVSDRISLNRTLPDVRMPQCRDKAYPMNLPKTSVIVVFHNEAWSTLLRSLHSVINRSPWDLLQEIIMIDDASERSYLKGPLEAYVRKLEVPCSIVHLSSRSGLIRARLRGAELAKAPVLTFLDAHIEVTAGWLEPLLARIHEDKSRVVAPIIDVISDDTFEYVTASERTWGGFNWHMNFRWYTVTQRELDRRKGDDTLPIHTPTIAGGLFAIDKQYFYDIGSYDEGMLVWGGENLEISFRVWQCGGTLEIATCSHVGHVFRKQTPYTFPGGTAYIIHHNALRTVEVWMDDYKSFFYKMTPSARGVDMGNITNRAGLRKRLKCKSFKWYLENIYPESSIPVEYYSLGQIENPVDKFCLDTMGRKDGQSAGLVTCHRMGGNQAWSLTGLGEIRNDELCLQNGDESGMTKLKTCHRKKGKQLWTYDANLSQLRHNESQQCLTAKGDSPVLQQCVQGDRSQQWTLEDYTWTVKPQSK